METIIAAAIRIPVADAFRQKMHNGKPSYPEYLVVSAPAPARHHSIVHPLFDFTGPRKRDSEDQGFLTSTGRYVTREEAYDIVVAAKQPLVAHPSHIPGKLFSEDLW